MINSEVWILRLGHRISRDKRVTTHLALVGRALGARGMFISGDVDEKIKDKIDKVNERFGGSFEVSFINNSWANLIRSWKKDGVVVHLTMYGIPYEDIIGIIKNERKKVLVVVGGQKVPSMVYELADYNVSVTNQPHSEIAALALFLDRYFEGREPIQKNPRLLIVPSPRSKLVMVKTYF